MATMGHPVRDTVDLILRNQTQMNVAESHTYQLGEEQSVWFALTPLLKDPENPMQMLLKMSEKYGSIIPFNLKNQRIVFIRARKKTVMGIKRADQRIGECVEIDNEQPAQLDQNRLVRMEKRKNVSGSLFNE